MRSVPIIQTDKLYRLKRLSYYRSAIQRAVRNGARISSYLHIVLPLRLRTASPVPHALYLEFSNVCDISCVYCSYPSYSERTRFMQGEVVERIVRALGETPVHKVHIGGGEPTLHPEFRQHVEALAGRTRFLNIVTNGQWRNPGVAAALASGAFDMVEISVDAGDPALYESSRMGASHARLVENLTRLRDLRNRNASRTIISIRLMVRPSNRAGESGYLRQWKAYCDTIIPQYIAKPATLAYDDDVYFSTHDMNGSYPKCSYPSRALQIKADGTVPLCSTNGHADTREKIVLGNILTASIPELWNAPQLVQYRNAHKYRFYDSMPVCKGCAGA